MSVEDEASALLRQAWVPQLRLNLPLYGRSLVASLGGGGGGLTVGKVPERRKKVVSSRPKGYSLLESMSNVAALLVLWASLMRFFVSLFKPGPKKCPAQIMRFFLGGFFWGGFPPVW